MVTMEEKKEEGGLKFELLSILENSVSNKHFSKSLIKMSS